MGTVQIADFVQAIANLSVDGSGPENIIILSSAGVRGLRRDAAGVFTLLLEEEADARVLTTPLPIYRVGLAVNDYRPLANGTIRASFIPNDVPGTLTDTPGSVKIHSYTAMGVASDSLFCSILVYRFPVGV